MFSTTKQAHVGMFIRGFQRLVAAGGCSRPRVISVLCVLSNPIHHPIDGPMDRRSPRLASPNPPRTPNRRSWRFYSLLAGGKDVTHGIGDQVCKALRIRATELEDRELLALEPPGAATGM